MALNLKIASTDNFNKALFDFCRLKLSDINPVAIEFNQNCFGSWIIEFPTKRLVFDGKDSFLILQSKRKKEWYEDKYYSLDQLSNEILTNILESFI